MYLSYGTSSKPAGSLLGQGREEHGIYNQRDKTISNTLAPEKSASVELGTKWDILDDKLALTAAVFRIDTNNARMTLEDNSYAMVGKKRVQGFELGAAGNITPQWSVFGGYSYLKSELVRAGGSGKNYGLQDGNAFPNTPKNAFSLWTDYKVTPKFKLGGGAYYVSKVWGHQQQNRWVPAYWRFDAMASYRFNKFVSAQVNVNNLTNKAYYSKAQPSHYANMAPGRLVMGTLNLQY